MMSRIDSALGEQLADPLDAGLLGLDPGLDVDELGRDVLRAGRVDVQRRHAAELRPSRRRIESTGHPQHHPRAERLARLVRLGLVLGDLAARARRRAPARRTGSCRRRRCAATPHPCGSAPAVIGSVAAAGTRRSRPSPRRRASAGAASARHLGGMSPPAPPPAACVARRRALVRGVRTAPEQAVSAARAVESAGGGEQSSAHR